MVGDGMKELCMASLGQNEVVDLACAPISEDGPPLDHRISRV